MEGLTFSAGHQGNSAELRNAAPAIAGNRPTKTSAGDAAAQVQPGVDESRPSDHVRVEAQDSPFQARLNYDQDKAQLFVEILDQATGDVVQRIPAETAADTVRELTGSHGGTVVDKIA